MLDGIDVIFFDFDGVILESAGIKTAAFREVFADVDASVRFHLDNQGISRFEKFRFHCEQVLGLAYDEEVERAMNAAFDAIVQRQVDAAPFVPGALELLEALRGSTPAYVASGTPEGELHRIVGVRGLDPLFAGVHGSPRSKSAIARDVLGCLDVAPQRSLFIGDATADLTGALDAGTAFIGRVAEGETSPFPAHITVISDLSPLVEAPASVLAAAQRELMGRSTK